MRLLDHSGLTDAEKIVALSEHVYHLEYEQDAMRAEYEAEFGRLREQISEWRESVKLIKLAAYCPEKYEGTDGALRYIKTVTGDILLRYPIALVGDDDSSLDANTQP